MSASSVRRTRERCGEGGSVKIPASAGKVSPAPVKAMSAGKENSRPTSRVRAATQKPSIRPMARMDKSAAAAALDEPRARRSTSSVPRGRSSSPSEFTRVVSDFRKNPSRASLGPPQRKGSSFRLHEKTGEKPRIEKKVRDFDKNGRIPDLLERSPQEKERNVLRFVKNVADEKKVDRSRAESVKIPDVEKQVSKELEKNGITLDGFEVKNQQENGAIKERSRFDSAEKKEGHLSLISVKRTDFENGSENSISDSAGKLKSSEEIELKPSGVGVELGSSVRELKSANKVNSLPSENSANKYPSKLHEKLAYLEGKVKKIASDIKRTKEMLDMNNPDASKKMLSDIQDKISGIEKAISHAGGNGDTKISLIKNDENVDKEKKELVDTKSLAKGLNVEELEARFFPHHKLIRDRTLSKTLSEGSESHVSKDIESVNALNVDGEEVSSYNVNVISMEVPTSLGKQEEKIGADDSEVQETDDVSNSIAESSSLNVLSGKGSIDTLLMADENLNEFEDQEQLPNILYEEENDESSMYQLNDIGRKTSTGGWFMSEGESVLLAHADGSCSFYDIANCEEKAEYKPPMGVSPNMWRDCWIIRAPSADGCSGRYVVAASAGNSVDSGFCSWDFYTKEIRAYHLEDENTHVRTALAPLSNNTMYRRNALSTFMASENQQWWYKPCGPLIVSTASSQRMVQIYDIRDGEQVMKWELQRPVVAMDYASPLQWRNRGKVVVVESDAVSLWDVSSLGSQALMSVSTSGRKVSALHVNNTDAELGGGVRQRISSSEAEGNDGVFCTPDSINVLDFRHPSGIGLKIPKVGVNMHSAFSRGDSIYIGCTNLRSTGNKQPSSQIQHFSLRKQRLQTTYALPESNAHHHFTTLTQVWGNSTYVMGVCGLGLFVFDSVKDDGLPSFAMDYNTTGDVKEVIGPDDMYYPSFDYLSSRVLLISRDRPAQWRYLL